jgi:hypothetical protein
VRRVLPALVATLACGGLHPPALLPPGEPGLAQARAALEEADARRDDVRLVEGGLVLHAHVYVNELHSLAWEPSMEPTPFVLLDLDDPYVVSEEVLGGKRDVYVRIDALRAVSVRSWAIGGHGVELELADAQRLVLRAGRDEAERLAAAIESLRRSLAGTPPVGAPAP